MLFTTAILSKGAATEKDNYRDLKTLEHILKVIERLLGKKGRDLVDVL